MLGLLGCARLARDGCTHEAYTDMKVAEGGHIRVRSKTASRDDGRLFLGIWQCGRPSFFQRGRPHQCRVETRQNSIPPNNLSSAAPVADLSRFLPETTYRKHCLFAQDPFEAPSGEAGPPPGGATRKPSDAMAWKSPTVVGAGSCPVRLTTGAVSP